MEQTSTSVTVYIRRLPQFAMQSRKELQAYFDDQPRGYGSYFAKNSAREGTGLTIPEENLLMPMILNIPKEDRDFRLKVTEYFAGLTVKVPGGDGLKLEVGLMRSNSEPVSEDNLPIAIDDYIKYRHALEHPWIAPSEASGKGNMLKQYYLFNPSEVTKANVNINEQKDTALGYYLVIKSDARAVAMYLTLLGVRTDTLSEEDQVLRLRELVNTNPAKFIAVYDDRDKEIKYYVESMINFGILERVNTAILVVEDGTKLGRDMKETIVFLQDSKNSKLFSILKIRLQEKWKKTTTSMDTDDDLKKKINLTKAPDPTIESEENLQPAAELMPAVVEAEVEAPEGSIATIDE